MALRTIRHEGDELLRKKSRVVTEVTQNILTLLEDMKETLYFSQGLGLAAPQVGVLRRVILVDIRDDKGLIEMINPEIVEQRGSQKRTEGCLSVPGTTGKVDRPQYVKIKAHDRDLNEFFVEGEDLLAVALCHEIDHLDGILYIDKAEDIEELEQDDFDFDEDDFDFEDDNYM